MSGGPARAWYTTAFGAHYLLLYPHRDRAEARRCVALLPRLAPLGSGPVLDLGCGPGRHLEVLRQVGLAAVGVDLSPSLLAAARRVDPAGEAPLVRADMRAIPLREGACTAVLSLFTSFGYFGTAAAHAPVAREVARVLAPGGHWFLDFLNSRRVRAELRAGASPVREREAAGLRIREQKWLLTAPDRVVKRVELVPSGRSGVAVPEVPDEGLVYTEEVSLLELDELDGLAADHGLARVAAAGDYDGGPLEPDRSPRWLLVYRRKERA